MYKCHRPAFQLPAPSLQQGWNILPLAEAKKLDTCTRVCTGPCPTTALSLLTWDFESITCLRTERKNVVGSGAGSRSPVSLVHHHAAYPRLGPMSCGCLPRVTSPAEGQGSCPQQELRKCCKLLDVCLCRLPQTLAFPAYVLHVRARTPWSYVDATQKKFGLLSSGKPPTLK